MKRATHPVYQDITATCACGATFQVASTVNELKVEICSSCHPFYSGKQKLVDTEGRVERFRNRYKNYKK